MTRRQLERLTAVLDTDQGETRLQAIREAIEALIEKRAAAYGLAGGVPVIRSVMSCPEVWIRVKEFKLARIS
jgi:hypothetical protein